MLGQTVSVPHFIASRSHFRSCIRAIQHCVNADLAMVHHAGAVSHQVCDRNHKPHANALESSFLFVLRSRLANLSFRCHTYHYTCADYQLLTHCRWVMYNQHQAALLELQQNNMHTQIDLKALSQPTDQVCCIHACTSLTYLASLP